MTMWVLSLACLLVYSTQIVDGKDVVELTSTYREPLFVYPAGINYARDLPYCESSNIACNIVHKRFWFSPLVMRLCQCVDKAECPYEWLDKDDHLMYINPRAQLKFCAPVTRLHACAPKETALTSKLESNDVKDKLTVEAKCFCPKFHHFDQSMFNVSYIGNTTTFITRKYTCEELKDCHAEEFCGHITGNLYQTYYVCTCPANHLCLLKDREKIKVDEALFEGEAYRGVCTPW